MNHTTPVDFFELFSEKHLRLLVRREQTFYLDSNYLIFPFVLLSSRRHNEVLYSSPHIGFGFGRHGLCVSPKEGANHGVGLLFDLAIF